MSCTVNFVSQVSTNLPSSFFKRIIRKSLNKLGFKKKAEISLVLTDQKTIQRLNKKYRKKDKPTTVLSFVFHEKEKKGFVIPKKYPTLLGEIIICLPRAQRKVLKKDILVREEITFLLIHGLLHLLGLNHKNKKQRKIMEGLEKKLIEKLT